MKSYKHLSLTVHRYGFIAIGAMILLSVVILTSPISSLRSAPLTLQTLNSTVETWNTMRIQQLWKAQGLNPTDVEGGMHPIQAAKILELIHLAQTKDDRTFRRICEVGFFRGGSTLLWLLAIPNSLVHSFDIHASDNAIQWFAKQFPGRWSITVGDSTKTIPEYHDKHHSVQCDLVLIDGNHQGFGPYVDLINMKKMSHPRTIVIMDDTFHHDDPSFDTKPLTCSQMWKRAKDEKHVQDLDSEIYGPSCTPFGRTPNNAWPIGQCTGEYVMLQPAPPSESG